RAGPGAAVPLRALAVREGPLLVAGQPARVGPALLDDRGAEPGELVRSHHERTPGLGIPGPGNVEKRRRLGRHVVEEDGKLAEGDLVAALERCHAGKPPPVEKRAVPRAEIPDEPLLVLETNLGLVAGNSDVVDDDFQPHLATDPDDRVLNVVDVVDLQRGSLDDYRQLRHLTTLPQAL